MTSDKANAVYDILVKFCQSKESNRVYFIMNMTDPKPPTEWRFQGNLGFGGKYYSDDNKVACYFEDLSPERDNIISATNKLLSKLE